MERRDFLKASAAFGCAATLSACDSSSSDAKPTPTAPALTEEKLNWSACCVDCGSHCPVRVFSRDGVITRIESNFTTDDEYGNHNVRACLRGRSLRKRVYAPERLKYPMKRVGPRGSGQFERISWDEALDTVAAQLKRIANQYGNEAIYALGGPGAMYSFSNRGCLNRLLNLSGGYLGDYGNFSFAQYIKACKYTYGAEVDYLFGSSIAEMANSDLVLMIGHNPSELGMSGSGQGYDFVRQKQQHNFKTIIIDPRYTDSSVGKEDQWIPIRPGTDAALVEAIAYVLISENRVNQAFLNQYCVGYDENTMPADVPYSESYKAYILDNPVAGDLTAGANAKTPAWAAPITGIPATTIIELAHELADAQAPFVQVAMSIGRHSAGENNVRTAFMLPILLGKVGLPGTNHGGIPMAASMNVFNMESHAEAGDDANPVKKRISFFKFIEAVENGKDLTVLKDGVILPDEELDENGDGKLDTDIKAIVAYATNRLINQNADVNYSRKVLADDNKCEFIVVIDNVMNASAEFADIILPDVTYVETEDLVNQGHVAGDTATLVQMSTSVGPMFESKPLYEMCVGLAKRMGIEAEFTQGKSHKQWLDEAYAATQAMNPGLPDKEVMLKQGIYRKYLPNGAYLSNKAFREDPLANPLPTPSGKIEIYSERLAYLAKHWQLAEGDVISALPKYVPAWDGFEDEATRYDYPLQLSGYHTKGRVHSSYHNVPWLREAVQDAVWMNPIDADQRGLSTGDKVRVFNSRGTIEVDVKVTPRVMPGVAALGQGAWLKMENGIDKGGNINVLTSHRPTPLSKGNGQHSIRVEIQRA
ncbi:molybdopterin-dependent oxidoreductase [Shewanella sp. A3A]|nr:molybdopterin-dependent oxidoreductase [Shewanella ferrihydritica]